MKPFPKSSSAWRLVAALHTIPLRPHHFLTAENPLNGVLKIDFWFCWCLVNGMRNRPNTLKHITCNFTFNGISMYGKNYFPTHLKTEQLLKEKQRPRKPAKKRISSFFSIACWSNRYIAQRITLWTRVIIRNSLIWINRLLLNWKR